MSAAPGEEPAADSGSSSWSPIITTAVAAGAQGAALYLLFECWRNKPSNKRHLEARRIAKPERSPAEAPRKGMFGWVTPLLKTSDEETHRCVGLDVYMFLRFLRMCFWVTAIGAVVSPVILIPTYYFGKGGSKEYNKITMANVEDGDAALWAPLIVWYFFVGLFLAALWKEWAAFLPLRYKFLAEGDAGTPMEYRYTLLVESIPEKKRSTGALYSYFYKLFPGEVVKANMCMETKHIEKLMAEREKAIANYEKAVATQKGKPDKPAPKAKVGGVLCCGGHKEDALPYYQGEIERLNREIAVEHGKMVAFGDELSGKDPSVLDQKSSTVTKIKEKVHMGPQGDQSDKEFADKWDSMVSSTGFVTFNSLAAKAAGDQSELSGKPMYMETFPAPEPRDMIWENVTTPLAKQRTLKRLVNCVWILGILFWAIPVAFTQAIANLPGLKERFPWIWVPPEGPVFGIITGYLPVIALLLLMILLPVVIGLSAQKIMKLKSHSAVDRYVFKWHFGFQVANLWLILIGGSLFNQLSAMIENPSSIVGLIADAVPGASQFFLNTTLQVTFGGLMMELSGVIGVLIATVMACIKPEKCRSQRELDAQVDSKSIHWGKLYPPIIFQLLVALTYICIVPVIEIFCAIYFGLAYLVWKHQALNVYSQRSEGGGALWPLLFSFIMGCLLIAEVVMIAYFGVKRGSAQAPLAVIPLLATIVYWHVVQAKFINPSKVLALEAAREVDESTKYEDKPRPYGGHDREYAVHGADSESKDGYDASNGYKGGIVSAAGGYGALTDSQEYAQPALRPSTWETEPQPYRRTGPKSQGQNENRADLEAANQVTQS